jgi:hypothetical protein
VSADSIVPSGDPSQPSSADESAAPRTGRARLERRVPLQVWLYPFLFLLGASALIFLTTFWLDARRLPKAPALLWNLTHYAGAEISDLLRDVSQLVTALLGVAISVVAIIVELAANRYTHKITELFFRSTVNFSVMGFFVIAAIDSIWVSFTIREEFMPVWGTLTSMALMTLSMLLLLPYFAFVFDFLNPLNIVERIRSETLSIIRDAPASITTARRSAEVVQQGAADGTEQLSDVVLNAMANHDGAIAIASVTALGDLGQDYLVVKGALPLDWFVITDAVAQNPDFVSMSPEVLESVGRERDWFEFKLLRQFQTIYQGGLGGSRELCYVVAIKTRELAESAMERNEPRVVSLCIKFFNTYLRSTVNSRDVRTAYNVFHQYRLLADTALRRNEGRFAIEIARYFKYYGQLAFNADLGFILETSAYDLCTLNEIAFNLQSPERKELLHIFLQVDKEGDGGTREASLKGVRKAQVKLATWYLLHRDEASAREVFRDMRYESPARLASIRDEILSVTSPEFWEITDRGTNFDFIPAARKRQLVEFFGWFGDTIPAPRVGLVPDDDPGDRPPPGNVP